MKKLLILFLILTVCLTFVSVATATNFENAWVTTDISKYNSNDFPEMTGYSHMLLIANPATFPSEQVSVNSDVTGTVDLYENPGWKYWMRAFDSPPIGERWATQYEFQSGSDTATLDLSNCTFRELDVPQNITINNATISWDPVENARYYRLRVFDLDESGNPKIAAGPIAQTDLLDSTTYVRKNPVPGKYALRIIAYGFCGDHPVNKSSITILHEVTDEIVSSGSPKSSTPTEEEQATQTEGNAANTCISGEASPGPFLVNSGNFYHTQSDLSISGLGPDLKISRYYNTHDLYAGPFGYGWNMNYNTRLVLSQDADGTQYATVRMGNGVRLKFTRNDDGTFSSPPGKNDTLVENDDDTFTLNGSCSTCTQKPTPSYTFHSDGSLASISDMNGNTLTIGYNTDGRIASATDANGRSLDFSYGTNGRVSTITDFTGRNWSYGYDSADNLTSVTYPDGTQIQYSYDDNHNLTGITDAKGNSVTRLNYDSAQKLQSFTERGGTYQVTYDPESRLTQKTDPAGNVFSFGYDDNGNIVNKTAPQGNSLNLTWGQNINVTGRQNPRGIQSAYSYDERGNMTSATRDAATDGLNATTSYTYDTRFDKPVSVTDPMGRETQMTYDDQGNLLSRQRPIGTTQYEYDANGNLTRVTDPDGYKRAMEYDANGYLTRTYIPGSDPVIETTYTYDQRGNVLSKTDPNGNTTTYTYDSMDRLLSITYADGSSVSFAYDANGNLVSRTGPLGVETVYEYDQYNQLIRKIRASGTSNEQVTEYTYDGRGNLASVTGPQNNTTTYNYDERNRLKSATTPLGQTVEFQYDPAGNLTARTDPNGNTISYSYDALNRLTRVTDAEGHVTSYTYDMAGNLLSIDDANNHTAASNTYDANDRLTRTEDALGYGKDVTYTDGGRIQSETDANGNTTNYVYDSTTGRLAEIQYPDGRTETYAYDAAGNLLSVSDSSTSITVSYTYDARNRVKTETQLGQTITYEYDAAGNRTSMSIPDLGTFSYTYDAANRLTEITNPSGETAQINYFPDGQRETITYDSGAATAYSYDAANRLQSITHTRADGSVVASFDYSYDNAANRLSVTDHNGDTITYNYDNTYKLTEAAYPNETVSFAYDGAGNRQSRTEAAGTTTYTYDAANRLTEYTKPDGTTVSLTYDNNGNISTKTVDGQTTTYAYDAKDQLRSIEYPDGTVNTFTYDPMGRRVRAEDSQGVHRFLYDGDNVVASISGTSSPPSYETVYTQSLRLDDLISRRKAGQTDYYLRDGLNSVRMLLGSQGTVEAGYEYYPYGRVKSKTGTTESAYTYTGRRAMEDSDMMYYRSRYYDPKTGRFVKKDRYTGDIKSPLSLNRYGYVNNNPANFYDPMGLVNWSLVGRGAAITGLGIASLAATIPAAVIPPLAGVTAVSGAAATAYGISEMTMGFASDDEEMEQALIKHESIGTSPVAGATTFAGTAIATGSKEKAYTASKAAATGEKILTSSPRSAASLADLAWSTGNIYKDTIDENNQNLSSKPEGQSSYVPTPKRQREPHSQSSICQMND
mgnify:CR=1 FL=1